MANNNSRHHYSPAEIIAQTQKWIKEVVIGLNFCPFAAPVLKNNSLYFDVVESPSQKIVLERLVNLLQLLDKDQKLETGFCILPLGFADFQNYLQLVALAEELLIAEGYEGVYQIAGFHPLYCFSDAPLHDAANYTNRSPYAMLHVLRENSITKALQNFPNADSIPQKNIINARNKGLEYLQNLRESCFLLP